MARQRSIITRLREAYNSFFFGYGSRTYGDLQGGLYSPRGAGTTRDKSHGSFYLPTHITNIQSEVIYRESWAAGRAIDMPVDDMFLRCPEFEEGNDDSADDLMMAISDLQLYWHLSKAMKMARLHGTGMMIVATRDGDFESPLDPEMVMPNDVVGFFTVDRWCCHVERYQENLMMPRYRQPEYYSITLSSGTMIDRLMVHHSRVFRFDGVRPLSDYSIGVWEDRDWGASELIRIIKVIMNEELAVSGITHLTQEASVPVIKSEGFTESLRQGDFSAAGAQDEVSMEKVAQQTNDLLSTFRILFADAEGDISRVNVPFGGLPDLMDRYAQRIASAVGIPVTRFLARSPVGLQSTGTGEERDYARDIKSKQEKMLKPVLDKVFELIGKSVGIMEVPDYHFPSIIDISDADKAETSYKTAQAIMALVNAGVMDENEAREWLQKAVPDASHLDPMSDEQLEAIRFDPVEEARIAQLQSQSNNGPQNSS